MPVSRPAYASPPTGIQWPFGSSYLAFRRILRREAVPRREGQAVAAFFGGRARRKTLAQAEPTCLGSGPVVYGRP